jgi:hypothetical protein
VTTAALELPFEPLFRAPLPPDDDELRLRDDAEDVRLLEALVLFGLLRELAERLLAEEERLLAAVLRLFVPEALLLFVPEALVVLGLDPFELLDADLRFVVERELAWAMSPSLGRCPRALKFAYPVGSSRNALGTGLRERKQGRQPNREDHMAFEDDEKRADEETLPDTSLHAYGEGREEDVEGDQDKLQSSDPETSQREEISEGDDAPQMPEQPKE